MTSKSNDDKILWQQMKAGDQSALAALFRRYYGILFDYSCKFSRDEELAKDCIQTIFSYIWQKRQTLAAVESVRTYLLTSVRHELLKNLRKNDRLRKGKTELAPEIETYAFSPEELLLLEEQNSRRQKFIKEALETVPNRMREALYLKTYNGLTYQEISEIMGVSSQVARNYVFEAFKRLRKLVD